MSELTKSQKKLTSLPKHELSNLILMCMDIIATDLIAKVENWNDETEYGEPSLWIELPHDRHIEITHEENGLAPENQYYSWRIHCSDDEFANDKFHSTMGVVDQTCINNFDDTNKIIDLLIWSIKIANLDVN